VAIEEDKRNHRTKIFLFHRAAVMIKSVYETNIALQNLIRNELHEELF